MSRNTAHWTGCGFVNNAQPRFAPGAALTLSNAPNASIGQTAFFSYPPGCISNGPPSTYATATQVSGGGNYFATAGDPALYDDNVACIFDCPRTSVRTPCIAERASALGQSLPRVPRGDRRS